MTNEIEEFLAYTEFPNYIPENGKDLSFLGRFTFPMLHHNYGFSRIFRILARGYLFGGDDPYENVAYARRALCAWCSVPTKEKVPENKPGLKTNFKEYHGEFPELVDEKGAGWYYRHVKNIIRTVKKYPDRISKPNISNAQKLSESFTANWKKKVRQYNIPAYSSGMQKEWMLLFDFIIAEALEEGPLRSPDITLTDDTAEYLREQTPDGVPEYVLQELAKYYLANEPKNGEWIELPQQNFSAYFGNTMFDKKWITKLPESFFVRKSLSSGACKYRIISENNLLKGQIGYDETKQ